MIEILEEYIEMSASVRLAVNAAMYALKIGVIVILAFTASKITKRLIGRLAASWRDRGHDRKADTLATVLLSLSRYGIGFIAACVILGVFNIPIASVLAVAGIGSVALGFGAQSLVKDFITGFFLLLEDQFGVGDIVTLAGKTGTVEAIGMRTTRLRGLDGEEHIIPNSQILFVTNLHNSYRFAIVDVFAEITALGAVCDEMRAAKEKIPALISEPSVIVVADGSIRIIADCRVGEHAEAEREIKRLVRERFQGEGIKGLFRGDRN